MSGYNIGKKALVNDELLCYNLCNIINIYIFFLHRILSAIKLYAHSSDLYHVAAFLASRFLTRSDVKEVYLAEFFDCACNVSIQASICQFCITHTVLWYCRAQIRKHDAFLLLK